MKKINSYTVKVYWKVNDDIQFKLSVPHVVSSGKVVHSMTVNIKETACDFLNRAIKVYLTEHAIEKIDETEIVSYQISMILHSIIIWIYLNP